MGGEAFNRGDAMSFGRFIIYLIANTIISFCFVIIAGYWFRLRDAEIVTTPSMRKLLGLILIMTALTFTLGAIARFYVAISGIDLMCRIALAVVTVVTTYTVVSRTRIIMRRNDDVRPR